MTISAERYIATKIKSENFAKDAQCRQENPLYKYNSNTNECEKLSLKLNLSACDFEFKNVQEYKGDYSGSSHYIVYEGVIQNNSDKEHFLNAILAKIYTEDNVLVTEGYASIAELIEPGVGMPFKVHTGINGNKYFNDNVELRPDIYPWFLTCK
ncbi:MAG: hypothetical protein Q8Q48_00570 [Candidatus Staskawiczbacteria bacterium]|nr:hypothetical protein [Candidatus Staskawiczbacteria bacterium]